MDLPRRNLLQTAGYGLGALALGDMLADTSPLATRKPHHHARAKRIIHLFMNGGPSQVDTFDPKPEVTKLHGQPLPDSVKAKLQTHATQPRRHALRHPLQVCQTRRKPARHQRALPKRRQTR